MTLRTKEIQNRKQVSGSKSARVANSSHLYDFIGESLTILVWIYIITNLFIFDVDGYLIKSFSDDFSWIVEYKIVFLLGIAITFWVFTSNMKMLGGMAYILFYPIIVIAWIIPKAIYRVGSWNLAIAYINSIFSFFRSLKFNFIVYSILIIASVVILASVNQFYLISISVVGVFGVITTLFITRFIMVFRPSIVYTIHSRIVSTSLSFLGNHFSIKEDLRDLPLKMMSEVQKGQWASNLQTLILASKVCYFLSLKFQEYQKSKYTLVFNGLSLVWLFLMTVFTFSLIHFGIYQVDPTSFQISSITPSLFAFFYYSFNIIHFSSVPEILVNGDLPRAVAIAEQVYALLLGVILLTLFSSIKNEKEITEINETVLKIKKQGDELSAKIEKDYKLSIDDAIVELEKLKSSMVTIIYYITNVISSKNSESNS